VRQQVSVVFLHWALCGNAGFDEVISQVSIDLPEESFVLVFEHLILVPVGLAERINVAQGACVGIFVVHADGFKRKEC
jgi:hypothetical protein